MIYVVVVNNVTESNKKEFMEISLAHASDSLMLDKGCIAFDVIEGIDDKEEIVFIEKWEDKSFLDAHAVASQARGKVDKLNALRYAKNMKIYRG